MTHKVAEIFWWLKRHNQQALPAARSSQNLHLLQSNIDGEGIFGFKPWFQSLYYLMHGHCESIPTVGKIHCEFSGT